MTNLYHNFFGLDIGKFEFVVNIHNSKSTKAYPNEINGIELFYQEHESMLKTSLVVLEVTGGYERQVIRYLQSKDVAVHRANGRQIKNFIRSHGIIAKNDNIDARALSLYGYERADKLELYQENKHALLRDLQSRRSDLVAMRAAEKNRAKAPSGLLHKSFKVIMATLNEQISLLDEQISELIGGDVELREKVEILQTLPGVGKVIATNLIAVMPELGSMNRKQVASLAGLAPHPNQSGKKDGYRRTRGGRREVPVILHMASLAASRSKCRLGEFYARLVASGKAKLVALTALARKIIVIANARIKVKFYQTT